MTSQSSFAFEFAGAVITQFFLAYANIVHQLYFLILNVKQGAMNNNLLAFLQSLRFQ